MRFIKKVSNTRVGKNSRHYRGSVTEKDKVQPWDKDTDPGKDKVGKAPGKDIRRASSHPWRIRSLASREN